MDKLRKNEITKDQFVTSNVLRALTYIENTNMYHQYKVVREIYGVSYGEIASSFNQIGGGIQYKLPNTIKVLVETGYLEIIQ